PSLRGAQLARRRIVSEDEVSGHTVEIGAWRQPRRALPVVLGAPEAPELALLEDLIHEKPVELASLVLRDDVPIFGRSPDAPLLVGGEGCGGVLAVRDRPEERDLREESLPGGGAELRGEKPRLALAPDGRREEGKVRDDR